MLRVSRRHGIQDYQPCRDSLSIHCTSVDCVEERLSKTVTERCAPPDVELAGALQQPSDSSDYYDDNLYWIVWKELGKISRTLALEGVAGWMNLIERRGDDGTVTIFYTHSREKDSTRGGGLDGS